MMPPICGACLGENGQHYAGCETIRPETVSVTVIQPLPKALKERYEFTCPVCSTVGSAAPSIMMIGFNTNTGHGTCKCGVFLHLEIDASGEKMAAMKHGEWLKGWLASREQQGG